MQTFLTWLFAVYFFSTCAICVCVSALICLLTAPFDANRRAVHAFSSYWGYHYLQLFWKMSYEGVDLIDPKKTYVQVANHQSLADILALYGLHKPFKWVSKESIYKVPFIGWNMWLNQYVLIRRGDLKSIKLMMDECRSWLRKGASVAMFPEGTRSKDGEMQAFRDGAFRLAMDCGVDVVPILIDGSFDTLPSGSKVLHFQTQMKIKVLPPISCAPFEGSSGKMRTYVHDLMVEELAKMRSQKQSKLLPTASS